MTTHSISFRIIFITLSLTSLMSSRWECLNCNLLTVKLMLIFSSEAELIWHEFTIVDCSLLYLGEAKSNKFRSFPGNRWGLELETSYKWCHLRVYWTFMKHPLTALVNHHVPILTWSFSKKLIWMWNFCLVAIFKFFSNYRIFFSILKRFNFLKLFNLFSLVKYKISY